MRCKSAGRLTYHVEGGRMGHQCECLGRMWSYGLRIRAGLWNVCGSLRVVIYGSVLIVMKGVITVVGSIRGILVSVSCSGRVKQWGIEM